MLPGGRMGGAGELRLEGWAWLEGEHARGGMSMGRNGNGELGRALRGMLTETSAA